MRIMELRWVGVLGVTGNWPSEMGLWTQFDPVTRTCQLSGYVQNFVTSVKLKSFTFIGGATISKDSSPLARTGVPIASTLESM